jgi:AraC-like DNA-binding protein
MSVIDGVSFSAWRPPPPVAAYVQSIRFFVLRGGSHDAFTVVSDPTACTELVVATSTCMTDHRPDGALVGKPPEFVFGPMSSERGATIHLDRSEETRVLSIVFNPGVFFELARVSAHELRDRVVTADELVPAALLRGLRAELTRPSGDPSRASIHQVLAQALADVGLPDPRLRRAVVAIAEEKPVRSVTDIVAHVGLSERQAQRAFAQRIGLTPKELQRLYRFRGAARRLRDALDRPEDTLAAIAAAAGYADQGHFSREFREFAGTSPSRYPEKQASALYLGQPRNVGNIQEPLEPGE